MTVPFTCPHCGHQTNVADEYIGTSGPCIQCQEIVEIPSPSGPPTATEFDATTRMILPVGRSGWAIAAGYAGLLAVTCVLAPVALILGIIAIRDLKRHPEQRGMGRAVFGLVMGLIGTLALLLGLLAIPFS